MDRALQLMRRAEAQLLNDTTLHANGDLYVSDTFGPAVYQMRHGEKPELVLQDPILDGPNGLHISGDTLTIASTGSFTDFSLEAPVLRFDLVSAQLRAFESVRGKFDGVEPDGDGSLLTDFRGKLLR